MTTQIFMPVPIAPIPLLSDLRDAVITRSKTRMPKWKFRLVHDIVMQIQPRLTTVTKENLDGLPWFDCQAVIRDDATGAMLKDPPRDSWRMQFRVSICDPTGDAELCSASQACGRRPPAWRFKVKRYGNDTGCQGGDGAMIVRDRLIDMMPRAFARLHPDMMLKPSCLMCGKMLTDPVSMARWIGPECAGTSSAVMPYLFNLQVA